MRWLSGISFDIHLVISSIGFCVVLIMVGTLSFDTTLMKFQRCLMYNMMVIKNAKDENR